MIFEVLIGVARVTPAASVSHNETTSAEPLFLQSLAR